MLDRVPQVFISYSWTSKVYQQNIIELASRMRHDGVDVKLDVWDLKIAALYGFGASMFLVACVLRILMPQFYFWGQLLTGLICLTWAIIWALPYFKQPLEVDPYFQSHPKLLALVSGGMKLCVFILEVAKPLRIMVIIMALVMILFKRFLF